MPWSQSHTFLLIVSPLAILGFWFLRRFEDDPGTPYAIAMRRFRIAMLIGGIGGLFGLLRLWLMYH
jgi:hypothetical protein